MGRPTFQPFRPPFVYFVCQLPAGSTPPLREGYIYGSGNLPPPGYGPNPIGKNQCRPGEGLRQPGPDLRQADMLPPSLVQSDVGGERGALEQILNRRRKNLAFYETNNQIPPPLRGASLAYISNSLASGNLSHDSEIPGIPSKPDRSSSLPQRAVQPPALDVSQEVSNQLALVGAIKTNPKGIKTNQFDPIASMFAQSITNFERELARTNLDPPLRGAYEDLVAQRKAQLADHQTNYTLRMVVQ